MIAEAMIQLTILSQLNGVFVCPKMLWYNIFNSSFCSHTDPQYFLSIAQKRAKLLSFGMSQPFLSILVASVSHKLSFGAAVHMILPQSLKQLYRFTVLCTLVLCLEIRSNTCKLSKLHHRFTWNVHKCCMNVNDTYSDVSSCKWRLVCKFWQP